MFFNIQNVNFFNVLRAFFSRFMQMLEEHSILSFWKCYENVISECFLDVKNVQFSELFIFLDYAKLL